MRPLFGMLLCFAVSAATSTHAAINPQDHQVELDLRLPRDPQASIRADGIYRAAREILFRPLIEFHGGVPEMNPTGETLSIDAGEPFAVNFDQAGQARITILLGDEDNPNQIPESFIVSSKELVDVEFIENGDAIDLAQRFSNDEVYDVASRRRSGRRSRLHYRGASGCVAYVQRAIGWKGGRTGDGWEVTRTLRKHGWVSASCKNPMKGTVASWKGGRSGAGHTAIWSGSGWCYDLNCQDPGRRYRMIDCVKRPSHVAKF